MASSIGGTTIAFVMQPFDVVATRLYNQPVEACGKGKYYCGVGDCFSKIIKFEGLRGLYKGLGTSVLRLAPHTSLSLFLWTLFREMYADRFNDGEVPRVGYCVKCCLV